MLIWTRWGILGFVIPIAISVALQSFFPPEKNVVLPALETRERSNDDQDLADVVRNREKTRKADEARAIAFLNEIEREKKKLFFIASFIAAPVIWLVGRRLNLTESRVLVDQESGEHVTVDYGGNHTFFWIPMEYWAFIWVIIAGIYLIS